MNDLEIVIEYLYMTFSKYTTVGIYHCDCGCIDENDVKKISSKPLRELETDDLISYHGSALYTWGDVEHYKHFLPRICELISIKRDFSYVTLDEFHVKLEYAEWTKWPKNEQLAIKDYVTADWIDFANKQNSEIRDTELEAYGNFFELEDLIKVWDLSNSQTALRNFVLFFYYHGNQILNGGLKLNEAKYESELISLIHSDKLIERLESEFFKNETIDTEYAQKASIVLQIIEQQLRNDEINGR